MDQCHKQLSHGTLHLSTEPDGWKSRTCRNASRRWSWWSSNANARIWWSPINNDSINTYNINPDTKGFRKRILCIGIYLFNLYRFKLFFCKFAKSRRTAMNFEHILYLCISVIYFLIVCSTVVVIVLDNRQPVKTIAWVLVVSLLPVIGLVIYLFFAR